MLVQEWRRHRGCQRMASLVERGHLLLIGGLGCVLYVYLGEGLLELGCLGMSRIFEGRDICAGGC